MFEDKYLHKLNECVFDGVSRTVRQGVKALSVGAAQIKANTLDRFPLITTRKINYDLVLSELFWFLNGSNDLVDLLDDENPIWVGDAYRYYKAWEEEDAVSKDAFVNMLKEKGSIPGTGSYLYRYLGMIYGPMWRGQYPAEDFPDQIYRLVKGLESEPYSRRHLSVSWDPNVHMWPSNTTKAVLPPCHFSFQVTAHPVSDQWMRLYQKRYNCPDEIPDQRVDLTFSMRSTDIALGLPFNMASYATLLHLIANDAGMMPGMVTMQTGDLHLYESHVKPAIQQSERIPKKAPKIDVNTNTLLASEGGGIKCDKSNIELSHYSSHQKINYPIET